MAKINEQLIVVKLSQLAKDGSKDQAIADDALLAQIEAVLEELVPHAVVEIIKE